MYIHKKMTFFWIGENKSYIEHLKGAQRVYRRYKRKKIQAPQKAAKLEPFINGQIISSFLIGKQKYNESTQVKAKIIDKGLDKKPAQLRPLTNLF